MPIILNSVNPVDDDDNTPLHLAAGKGYFEIYKLIIQSTIQIYPPIQFTAIENPRNNLGQTPLDVAALNGYPKICEYIDSIVDK